MKLSHGVAYLSLALIWGLSFLALIHVVAAFGWAGAVTLRSFVAAGTLGVFAAVTRRTLEFRGAWGQLAIVGATTVVLQLVGLSIGTPLIGTAMASILIATIPLFSMIIGQVWGLEKMTPRGLAGLLLGFAGIVILVGFPAVPVTPDFLFGCAMTLMGALASAVGSNYASHKLKGVGSFELTIGTFLTGGLFSLPLLVIVPVPTWPTMSDYLYLLLLGAGVSAIAYIIYFRLVRAIGATRAISVEFVVTVVASVIGIYGLGESLSVIQLAGAVVILSGCGLVLMSAPSTA